MKKYSHRSKRFLGKSLGLSSVGVCLLFAGANKTKAQNYYLDVNGVTSGFGIANGGSYNWDTSIWTTNSAGTLATTAYTQGVFARFDGGVSGNAYTVTVNSSDSIAGLYEQISGVGVTINAGSGGSLNIASGVQGFLVNGATSSLVINAPLSGVGGVEGQLSGTLSLYANNSYGGGTLLDQTSINFNNANSFGTGPITVGAGGFSGLLSSGGSAITIANNFTMTASGGVNFGSAANTPVKTTGNWNAVGNLSIRNNGNSTAPLTIAGAITNSGNAYFSGLNSGTINLTAANTYTGFTTVSNGVTLKLGTLNAIGSTKALVLNASTLNPGGFNQIIPGMLTNQGPSTIDFSAGDALVQFADSHTAVWIGTLNLVGYGAGDILNFSDSTGLNSSQLPDIEFDGTGLGTATLDSLGDVVEAPEPSSVLLGFAGGLGVLWSVRRRKA